MKGTSWTADAVFERSATRCRGDVLGVPRWLHCVHQNFPLRSLSEQLPTVYGGQQGDDAK